MTYVVDTVDLVFRSGLKGDELALVLLDDGLLLFCRTIMTTLCMYGSERHTGTGFWEETSSRIFLSMAFPSERREIESRQASLQLVNDLPVKPEIE